MSEQFVIDPLNARKLFSAGGFNNEATIAATHLLFDSLKNVAEHSQTPKECMARSAALANQVIDLSDGKYRFEIVDGQQTIRGPETSIAINYYCDKKNK
jgi:hypothetical protein